MVDILNAPVPGESLTRPPGGAMYEQPPRFTDPEDALEYLDDRLKRKDTLIRLSVLAENEVSAEQIAKTILMAGFMEGLWTPDIILQISGMTMYLVSAILAAKGVNITMKSPNKDLQKFMAKVEGRTGGFIDSELTESSIENADQVFNILGGTE